METFDFVIIGAGPAGEAAAHEARGRGASVAIIDRQWFGGSCPHIGCLPSKSLLHEWLRAGAGTVAARPPSLSEAYEEPPRKPGRFSSSAPRAGGLGRG